VSPIVGDNDFFEGLYKQKFKSIASEQGEFIYYDRDRAAIDLGVHLTRPGEKGREVSQTRIWFQLKGKRSATLSQAEYSRRGEISLTIKLADLKFWFASPEPIYLVLYVECVDKFLAEDVQEIVSRQWGEGLLRAGTFPADQEHVTVHMPKSAELTSVKWAEMHHHRSMRIDGPLFRGRPLGHRLDPLRCTLKKFEPAVFCRMVGRLLDVHGYDKKQDLDPALLFPNESFGSEHAAFTEGILHNRFEWVFQMSSEFGIGRQDDFRTDGEPLSAQGRCAVLIHGDPPSYPNGQALKQFIDSLMARGIRQFLVFANIENDPGYFGAFFSAVRGSILSCTPLLLGEIAYCLLTTTVVYLEFRESVSWRYLNYLWQ